MRIPLNGKAYQERSVIASAQETVNWYAELNTADSGAPVPITYYPTPGEILFGVTATPGKARCTYRTSIGTAYKVIGSNVYFVSVNGAETLIGIIGDNPSQVYMADNGQVAIIVDGTTNGYAIELATNNFAPITDPSFYGADFVAYLLTFFVFNRPKTNQFYISLSQVSFGMLVGTAISTGAISNAGSLYGVGVWQSVPLTGGTGTGATADITVVNGAALGGGTIAGGSAYTDGVYKAVPLTGGLGSGAIADITIAGGAVTAVTFSNINDSRGQNYSVADVLTAPNNLIGGTGTGFTYTLTNVHNGAVADVSIDNPGEGYLIGDVLSADAANLGGTGSGFTFTIATTALAFDPLDIAAKSGSADPIVAILSIHEELWLIGALTTEVWTGTGAADFFFQQVQGAYIEHGCIAPYTAANTDVVGFWLMQDKQGKNIVIQGSGYEVDEISTPYLVDQFDNYPVVSDAIGFCFQIASHAFYCLIFPSQNITWLYELKTKQWNKWSWLNVDDGSLNRNRANCAMFFNGKNIVGDWETGVLYTLDSETYTDNGTPIIRIKTFIHMLDNMDRVYYRNFDLDIECGTQSPDILTEPIVTLSWSDDRGKSYGFPIEQSLGLGGQFKTLVSWNRLGYARDRVFRIQTSEPIRLALNGGFCEVAKGRT